MAEELSGSYKSSSGPSEHSSGSSYGGGSSSSMGSSSSAPSGSGSSSVSPSSSSEPSVSSGSNYAACTITGLGWTDAIDELDYSYCYFEIVNIGDVDIEISSITSTAPGFVYSPAMPLTLFVGSSIGVFANADQGVVLTGHTITVHSPEGNTDILLV